MVAKDNIWRIVTAAVSCFLMAVSGTQYLFSVFAPELKDRLHYTQVLPFPHYAQDQINLVTTFGNLGIYLGGIIPGEKIAYAHLARTSV